MTQKRMKNPPRRPPRLSLTDVSTAHRALRAAYRYYVDRAARMVHERVVTGVFRRLDRPDAALDYAILQSPANLEDIIILWASDNRDAAFDHEEAYERVTGAGIDYGWLADCAFVADVRDALEAMGVDLNASGWARP